MTVDERYFPLGYEAPAPADNIKQWTSAGCNALCDALGLDIDTAIEKLHSIEDGGLIRPTALPSLPTPTIGVILNLDIGELWSWLAIDMQETRQGQDSDGSNITVETDEWADGRTRPIL